MFANKVSTLNVVSNADNNEIMDLREQIKKILADTKSVSTACQAEVKVAREGETYFKAMYSDVDHMLKDMTKTHNELDMMSSQIKLGLVSNSTKLIVRIEHNDAKIAALEDEKVELQAQIEREKVQHSLTKVELDRVAYSRVPFFKRVISAAAGKLL